MMTSDEFEMVFLILRIMQVHRPLGSQVVDPSHHGNIYNLNLNQSEVYFTTSEEQDLGEFVSEYERLCIIKYFMRKILNQS